MILKKIAQIESIKKGTIKAIRHAWKHKEEHVYVNSLCITVFSHKSYPIATLDAEEFSTATKNRCIEKSKQLYSEKEGSLLSHASDPFDIYNAFHARFLAHEPNELRTNSHTRFMRLRKTLNASCSLAN